MWNNCPRENNKRGALVNYSAGFRGQLNKKNTVLLLLQDKLLGPHAAAPSKKKSAKQWRGNPRGPLPPTSIAIVTIKSAFTADQLSRPISFRATPLGFGVGCFFFSPGFLTLGANPGGPWRPKADQFFTGFWAYFKVI